jgi:hypothetical protein
MGQNLGNVPWGVVVAPGAFVHTRMGRVMLPDDIGLGSDLSEPGVG